MSPRHGICLAGATASLLVLAGGAGAAHPKAGKTYSGTGQEYENNGPHFETFKGFRQPVTLTVSATGSQVKHFTGQYGYYCGAGTASVVGTDLKISAGGKFAGRGSKPAYYRGKRTGTDYFVIRGQFIDAGKTANVTYQATFVGTTQKDPHPYALGFQSGSESCQNQVRGKIPVQ